MIRSFICRVKRLDYTKGTKDPIVVLKHLIDMVQLITDFSAFTWQIRYRFQLCFSYSILLEVKFYYNLVLSFTIDVHPSRAGLQKVKNDDNSCTISSG